MKQLGIVLVVAFLVVTTGVAPAVAAPLAAGACGPVYTVRPGDTLAGIAFRCGTSVSAILAANPSVVNPNRIFAGLRITIPGGEPPPVSGVTTYVVKRGDTLADIAARYKTTVSALLKLNPNIGDPNAIYVGQVIKVPSTAGTPASTTVKIPLIALNTGGAVGCGDSVVMVTRNVPPTTAPLTAAVNELLSIHTRLYGQSGLYNPLYNSPLAVQSVTISNGLATIRLTGNLSLAGECDDPRVAAMFNAIGRQFSTVQRVQVYINGAALETLLGGKGT
jgi:LysM repeat protein